MKHIARESRMNQVTGFVPFIMANELKKEKWDTLFDNEQELLEACKSINVPMFIQMKYGGYVYIESFQKRLNAGGGLTPAQLTQLKRLAKQVYCYHWNAQNTNWHRAW